MRLYVFSAILVFFTLTGQAQGQTPASNFNKKLADSLGADEYGMKWYVMVMLKTGTKKIQSRDSLSWLYKGHIDAINELTEKGLLIVTGPLGKNTQNYRSFYILNTNKAEEAQKLMMKNPAVKYGLFDPEFFFWYGPAALPTYRKYQPLVEAKKP
ncbi:YciI family protein [Tenuifilum thalassicum]|uniref:YCII-related domain-containing protein n=1 Tax=Tenuifilum thalassicum TaxID=2590900 RepID=A0A7D3XE33_9BACT|nr:hypothetical protein [Tenuifilum thalassicum]QKG79607.1 hypothetical protein FHG85_04800 [Tenuifilum thalassicum]